MRQFEKYSDHAYALLRIVAGFTWSMHGLQKLFGVLSQFQPEVGSQLWFAGIIETVGGLLILIGFQTTWAAFIGSGEMAVAYFQVHWKFQFDSNFFPIMNKGELAVLYCFLFLFIATRGGVKWDVDSLMASKGSGKD